MLKKCEICKSEFTTYPSRVKIGHGRVCSPACRYTLESKERKGKNKSEYSKIKCENCGIEFSVRPHRNKSARFCSWLCKIKGHSKDILGNKHPNWQGGKSYEPYPATFNKKFKSMIRERDKNTCAICGLHGSDVHHIDYNKLNTTPDNCITLCHSCHTKTGQNRAYWIRYFVVQHEQLELT